MFSIIVCTYNRDKFIYNCLRCVAENGFAESDYELLLINNNSTDNTENLSRQFATNYPKVNFRYFNELNQGLSFARNRGIAEARGDWFIFIDDDAMLHKGYLENLKKYIVKYPDADAFGGKIVPEFESGEKPAWLCKWTYSWVSALNLGKNVQLFKGGKYPIGANMGISRRAIKQCGTFDTSLGRSKNNLMGGEEKDIFNRIKAKDLKIYYLPNLVVNHIIPPHRTTTEFIVKLASGIGASERIRCKSAGMLALLKRYVSELVKWAATIVLWLFYMLTFRPACGNMLVRFRCRVSRSLLGFTL